MPRKIQQKKTSKKNIFARHFGLECDNISSNKTVVGIHVD